MGTIRIPTQSVPPNHLGPEIELIDFILWKHLLSEWEGLLEKDLIQLVECLELPAYRYSECRKRPDGKLVAKGARVQPYSVWRCRPVEEQEDSFIDPTDGGGPRLDYVIKRDFKDVFHTYDVVFRKEDLAELEKSYPHWKWPHVDPFDEEVMEEKKHHRPTIRVDLDLIAGKTPDMAKVVLRERFDEPIVAYVLREHFSAKGAGNKMTMPEIGRLLRPDDYVSDNALVKDFKRLINQAKKYQIIIDLPPVYVPSLC